MDKYFIVIRNDNNAGLCGEGGISMNHKQNFWVKLVALILAGLMVLGIISSVIFSMI